MTENAHIFSTDSDIAMLRDSARGFLAQKWPAARAVAASEQPDELKRLWREIAQQGWLALGSDTEDGGLRTTTVLLEELGRAGCPAPLLDAFLANTILRHAPGAGDLAAQIESGDAIVACVLGTGDATEFTLAGSGKDARLSGQAAFIEGAAVATHFLIVGPNATIAIVAAGAPGITITPTPGFAVPPLAEIDFVNTTAQTARCTLDLRSITALSRVGLAARALGAASRGFDLIVDYAKVRVQFGKKIGSYQAIQHKLANCLINLDIARLAVLRGAGAFDRQASDWTYAASAAFAVASPALRQVCLETHHAFGGVSFWEEHEMPRHFRRIHADLARCGGVHAAREEMAEFLLDGNA